MSKPDASRPADAGVSAPAEAGSPPVEGGPREDGGAPPEIDASRPLAPADAASPDATLPREAAVPDDAMQDAAPAVDAGARCLEGTYSGAFAGEISALFGFIRIDITGIISIDIAAGEDGGQQLPIRNGKLDGKDQDGNPVMAVVSGTMNCATRRLDNGRITEGTYTRKDPLWGGPPTTVRFTGTATAVYNFDPPSATGQWEVQNENGLRGGSGTWSTTLVR